MSWFSISGGMVRIGSFGVPWIFGVPWLLPLFFLISGFIITVGKWTGIHVYSRRRQSGQYWWSMFLLCVLIFVVEAFLLESFFWIGKMTDMFCFTFVVRQITLQISNNFIQQTFELQPPPG
jgi:uncharacterized RDD family membrane protein YckC